jgi:hypothetical protein
LPIDRQAVQTSTKPASSPTIKAFPGSPLGPKSGPLETARPNAIGSKNRENSASVVIPLPPVSSGSLPRSGNSDKSASLFPSAPPARPLRRSCARMELHESLALSEFSRALRSGKIALAMPFIFTTAQGRGVEASHAYFYGRCSLLPIVTLRGGLARRAMQKVPGRLSDCLERIAGISSALWLRTRLDPSRAGSELAIRRRFNRDGTPA